MPTRSQTSSCPSTPGPRSEAPNAPGASICSTASSRPEPPKRTRKQTTLPTLRTSDDNSPTDVRLGELSPQLVQVGCGELLVTSDLSHQCVICTTAHVGPHL